ncbi:MAG: Flp pilus assembly complex ATPase component TadA [Oscillospiraceae bacterium]|jgi:stage III sporulation protein AA|nr:Flp pilus assembly complex ATPase component TadA [Oscillospiraceae bacterium]
MTFRKSSESEAFCQASRILSEDLYNLLNNISENIKSKVQEIRLRVNCPLMICCRQNSYFLDSKGNLEENIMSSCKLLTKEDINENFKRICDYSVYSHQEEISLCYVTIKGGHRVGISGTATVLGSKIIGIRDISSLNIRIARQSLGCANKILESLINLGSGKIQGTLIAGEPSCGKTTILRDLARQLSIGTKIPRKKVTIIDERLEIAGTLEETWQNDVGLCDVLANITKGCAMLCALRSLSPEILVCDEVGDKSDIQSIRQVLNSGVQTISTIHAGSVEELLRKDQGRELLKTGAFQNIVIMKGRATPLEIKKIYKVSDEDAKIFRDGNANFLHLFDRISSIS